MRRQLLDTSLAQTIAWIWLGFLAAGLMAWSVYRRWRERHPPAAPPPELTYSQRLKQRLTRPQNATKRKPRSGSAKIRRRRP